MSHPAKIVIGMSFCFFNVEPPSNKSVQLLLIGDRLFENDLCPVPAERINRDLNPTKLEFGRLKIWVWVKWS